MRLALVENDLGQIIDNRKIFQRWMMGLLAFVLIQLGSFAYGYGQINQKMNDLDLSEFSGALARLEKNVDTALVVLADHGTEIQDVRNEQARVRGNIDQIHVLMDRLRSKVDNQTNDRFYKKDGDKLEERVRELELWRLRNSK